MIGNIDVGAIVTLIGAVSAAIISIIVALQQRPIATKVAEVHDAVATANGHTIGELAEAQEARHPESPAPPSPAP